MMNFIYVIIFALLLSAEIKALDKQWPIPITEIMSQSIMLNADGLSERKISIKANGNFSNQDEVGSYVIGFDNGHVCVWVYGWFFGDLITNKLKNNYGCKISNISGSRMKYFHNDTVKYTLPMKIQVLRFPKNWKLVVDDNIKHEMTMEERLIYYHKLLKECSVRQSG